MSAASSPGVGAAAVGKTYPPVVYAVGREKIREFATAVGETDPLYHDLEAARAAGHSDLVAPPMFATVYSRPAIGPVLFDPELKINFALLVYGAQAYEWGPLVIAGDEITTVMEVADISRREQAGLTFYEIDSSASNQRGEQVCTGRITWIVRDAA